MLNKYRLLLAITVSSFLNLFVYFLRRLPLIGRRIPESLYSRIGLKRKASLLVMILGLVWNIGKQLAYVGLLVYWPAAAASSQQAGSETLPLFLSILLVLSFVSAPFWNARVMETKRSKYVAVKLIRIPSTIYMKTTLSERYVLFFLSFLIAFMVFIPMAGGTLLDGLFAALALTAWRGFAEYMHLLLFERTGVILIKNNVLVWLVLIIGTALAYAPLLLGWKLTYGSILLQVPFVLVTAALGAWSAMKLARYPRYAEAVDATVKRDDPLLHLGQMITDAKKADVSTKAKDYAALESESSPGAPGGTALRRKGYARLDALFFRRHRRLVRKPLLQRLAIIGGVGAAACAVLAVKGPPSGLTLSSLVPFLPFALYTLALGEKFCRVLFYNCDRPLMRYSFYRQGAQQHFFIRLLRLSGMNLLVGAALAAVLTVIAAVAGWPLGSAQLLPLWLISLSLALLFSVHHLLLYYLLQPYTDEMDAKNPLFNILHLALGSLSWLTLFFRPLPELIAGVSLILAALYLAAAAVLIPRYSAHTFKHK
ncbi:hypothetical protein [Paenibacillus senegalensis]|uniref:hypothetical protein n=1 Tax=Paenibacillus senegalensis TaxID=1465766 RepID=UPI00028979C6|nr:hypothetical protein [Paenibacillus senegalensis]